MVSLYSGDGHVEMSLRCAYVEFPVAPLPSPWDIAPPSTPLEVATVN